MKKTQQSWNSTLKKTGFKRKATGKKKATKKTPHALAKVKAWDAFSRYIRLRDALRTTGSPSVCACVTCGVIKPTFGKNCIHAGHWLGGRKGKNLFEEHACHGQCSGCNLWASGNQTKYEAFMVDEYGHDEMDRITLQANTPYTYTLDELCEIEAEYKRKYEELTNV